MSTPESILIAQSAAEFLSGFDPNQKFVLTIVAISGAILILLILGGVWLGVWRSTKEKQIEADLKRDMLDRGMSAEEIQQVIEAQPRSGFDKWMTTWCKK